MSQPVCIHLVCKPGFFGTLCDTPCPPGIYGKNCGGRCFPFCSKEKCDHVYGCKQTADNILPTKYPEKPSLYDSKDFLPKSQFNTKDLFLVIGGIVIIVLIIVAVKFFKRSRSSNHVINFSHENDNHGESSTQPQQTSREAYDTLSETDTTKQPYQPLEAEYDDVNENPQANVPKSSKKSYEHKMERVYDGESSFKQESNHLDFPPRDFCTDQKCKRSGFNTHNSKTNIQEMYRSSNINGIHSYIDIVDDAV